MERKPFEHIKIKINSLDISPSRVFEAGGTEDMALLLLTGNSHHEA